MQQAAEWPLSKGKRLDDMKLSESRTFRRIVARLSYQSDSFRFQEGQRLDDMKLSESRTFRRKVACRSYQSDPFRFRDQSLTGLPIVSPHPLKNVRILNIQTDLSAFESTFRSIVNSDSLRENLEDLKMEILFTFYSYQSDSFRFRDKIR
jgi:hypothetical protein